MKDAVIVGGGLSGGGAAALLAHTSTRVLLLEREREPIDKVCGEFVSSEGVEHLAAIGLDVMRLGAHPIDKVRLAMGGDLIETRLPFRGAAITRRLLDEALLEHAGRCGAKIERGVTVRRFGEHGLETCKGDVSSENLLLATGKHELRGARRNIDGARTGLIGFKQYYAVDARVREAMSGAIELVLFRGGYAGMNLVEDGRLNLCFLVSRARFMEVGRRWDALFRTLCEEPWLNRRLAAADAVNARPFSISDVPYGFRYVPSMLDDAGFYRLGDQAAVIPSFTGDGMSIALHSARLAAKAVTEDWGAHRYHRRLRSDVTSAVRTAMALQRLVDSEPVRPFLMAIAKLAPAILTQAAALTRVSRTAHPF